MQKHERAVWWVAGAVSLIAGLVFVWRDNHNGWFLVILGTVYVGALAGTARGGAASNPRVARWGLLGIALLLVVVAVIVGAILRR